MVFGSLPRAEKKLVTPFFVVYSSVLLFCHDSLRYVLLEVEVVSSMDPYLCHYEINIKSSNWTETGPL